MADLDTNIVQIETSQSQKEVTANGLFDAGSPITFGGRRAEACAGLVWGYYGGRIDGSTVANGTLTLTDASDNYIVCHRSTRVFSASTSNTNWNDAATYSRLYLVTCSGAVVTNYEDHRLGSGGLFTAGASSGSGSGDFSSNTSTSVDSEIVLFSGTGGKTGKRATGTGLAKITSGVLSTASAGTDYYAPGGTDVAVADGGTGASNAADARTNLGLIIGTDVQAYDADLATIAGLTATSDNFMQAKSSAWASRTPLQAAADLQGTGLDVDMVGFRGVPINSQSGNYTTVAADAGKMLLHPSGAGAGDTYTIDSNANVAYEIGSAITFCNMDSNALSIAITSDTLNLAGAGTTGTRSLAQYGIATAVKVTTTGWIISGTGLT